MEELFKNNLFAIYAIAGIAVISYTNFQETLSGLPQRGKLRWLLSRLLRRGHSTPEMQLLRSVGVARGYDKYKFQRKVFEVLYSKLFFASLKEYHRANTHEMLPHYRQYLIYVYFQTVLTKINGIKCRPLSSAFVDRNDVGRWSMDGLFVACLGLSFRRVSDYNLGLFWSIIERFGLDPDHIRELSENYPEKFPVEE